MVEMHDQRAPAAGEADEFVEGSIQKPIPGRLIKLDGLNRVGATLEVGDLAALGDGSKCPRLRRCRAQLANPNCPGMICHSPFGAAPLSNLDAGCKVASLTVRQDRCTDEAARHDAAVSEEIRSALDDDLAPHRHDTSTSRSKEATSPNVRNGSQSGMVQCRAAEIHASPLRLMSGLPSGATKPLVSVRLLARVRRRTESKVATALTANGAACGRAAELAAAVWTCFGLARRR
jgi:hypothetical protein